MRLAQNTGRKKSPKIRHLGTIAQLSGAVSTQLRRISTVGKNAKWQYLLHMFSQCGELWPLASEIGLPVWGTPANFNGFRVLASLLHQRRSTEVNQTLHDVWPSLGLVHCYIHFRGLLSRNGIFQGAKFTLRPSLAFSYIGSVTARHSSSGYEPNLAALSRWRHLYSAGRPPRWAWAHIVLLFSIHFFLLSCYHFVGQLATR